MERLEVLAAMIGNGIEAAALQLGLDLFRIPGLDAPAEAVDDNLPRQGRPAAPPRPAAAFGSAAAAGAGGGGAGGG